MRYQLKHLVWDCYLTSWTSKERAWKELVGFLDQIDGHPVVYKDPTGVFHGCVIHKVKVFSRGWDCGIYSFESCKKLVALPEADFETLLMPEYWEIIEAEI